MSTQSNPLAEYDISYCTFGAATISKLLQTFKAQIEGVKENKDIEYIHKMRVVSRRLRAAMPLFQVCLPRKQFKKWLKEAKKVTQLLGEARDLDVQIAFVKEYTKTVALPKERAGTQFLLRTQKKQRTKIQPNVVAGLNELEASGVLEEIAGFCDQKLAELAKAPFDVSAVLEKAYWQISLKLDDFLSMEEYVHQQDQHGKHHEMRIKAKWLRYTMEAFAPLYKGQLDESIEVIKNFQDVLGEMHDCDVWINCIPTFIATAEKQTSSKSKTTNQKLGLLKFLEYVADKKQDEYRHFVELWDQEKGSNFFEELRNKVNRGFDMSEEKIKQALADPHCKIAVLSDIHANLQALQAVLQDAEKRGATVFLNAGDSIGFGPSPNKVLKLLNNKNALNIMGNYDAEVIEGIDKNSSGVKKIAFKYAKKRLGKTCQGYLLSFPPEVKFEVAGKKVLMVHGSPESMDEHIYHDTPVARLKELVEEAEADVIIVGHSHEQFHRQVNGVSFINPGSVGRPGDGNPQAGYALVSFDPFEIQLLRLDYDVADAAQAMRKKRLPESFAQMLLRGLAIDKITELDEENKDDMVNEGSEIVGACEEVTQKYLQDTEHSMQVTRLALVLFDGLKRLHKLGVRERRWLECAAVLHDIGLFQGASGHHKQSMTLILNETKLPFTSNERRVIASIARYHRKGLPTQKHFNLKTLNSPDVEKINTLAGLLRVADALDYTHQSVVKSLKLKITPKKITVECLANQDTMLEDQAVNKKKDLFEAVFNRNLVLTWMQQ
jgi:putative phosphoesterase